MWRTTDSGAHWTQVDTDEKEHAYYQIYQPDTSGVVYAAGIYSKEGNGLLKSTDFGMTWTHVGVTQNENIVVGTSKHIYAWDSTANGLEVSDDPAGTTWTSPMEPAGMCGANSPSGPICGTVRAAVTNDGKENILFAAGWNNGLWRYAEP